MTSKRSAVSEQLAEIGRFARERTARSDAYAANELNPWFYSVRDQALAELGEGTCERARRAVDTFVLENLRDWEPPNWAETQRVIAEAVDRASNLPDYDLGPMLRVMGIEIEEPRALLPHLEMAAAPLTPVQWEEPDEPGRWAHLRAWLLRRIDQFLWALAVAGVGTLLF